MAEGPRRVGILRPLRIRDFRLLWTAMTVSLLGDGIFIVALAWQVYRLSNVPTALAVVGVAWTLPQLPLSLYAGVVSDRVDRRRLLVLADAIRAVAIGTLGALSVTHVVQLWHIYALTAVYGAGQAFFGPAFGAIVPDIVPEEMLTEANSLEQFVRPLGFNMIGPAIGGLLVHGVGAGWAFLGDAGSFVFSGAVVVLMARRPIRRDEGGSVWREMAEGFRFVRSRAFLWGGMVAATVALLVTWGPYDVLVPFIVKNRIHGSAADLGWVFGAGGAGSVVAALVLSQRGLPRRFVTFLFLSWAVSTFSIAGFAVAASVWQAMVVSAFFGATFSSMLVAWFTTLQRLVPGELLGRVTSLDWLISIALVPLSFAITGPVAGAIGARATMVAAGAIGGSVILLFLYLVPGIRDPEREEAREPA